MARELLEPGEFIEIFVDTPLEDAEKRDPQGLYNKARRGDLKHFTGIVSPYERPENPEITIDTRAMNAEQSAEQIIGVLLQKGIIEHAFNTGLAEL